MAYYDFPHTRNYDTDLGYLIKQFKSLRDEIKKYTALSTITYSDPIEWSITSQYKENTIVVHDNIAYLSKQPVGTNVEITNTDYWQPIYDLARFNVNPYTYALLYDIDTTGKTDCSYALNEALTNFKLANNANYQLYLPTGRYLINNDVIVEDCILVCDNETIFEGTGNIILYDASIINGQYLLEGEIRMKSGLCRVDNIDFISKKKLQVNVGVWSECIAYINNSTFDGSSIAQFAIWADDETTTINNAHVNITNCYFHNFYLNAIFSSAIETKITNCKFVDNHLQTTPVFGGHIDIKGHDTYKANALIESCTISGGGSGTDNGAYAIESEGGYITAINNNCDVPGACITLQNQSTGIFINNIIKGLRCFDVRQESRITTIHNKLYRPVGYISDVTSDNLFIGDDIYNSSDVIRYNQRIVEQLDAGNILPIGMNITTNAYYGQNLDIGASIILKPLNYNIRLAYIVDNLRFGEVLIFTNGNVVKADYSTDAEITFTVNTSEQTVTLTNTGTEASRFISIQSITRF